MQDDALIEFVGDQVMALYLPGFPSLRERTGDIMLAAAERLVREIHREWGTDSLGVGVGMNFGIASTGNIRKGAEKDFTAVGDVVNTASRLQAAAGRGEVILAEALFQKLTALPQDAKARLIEVKGKADPLRVRVVSPG
jgi:adenylate cyclase